MGGASLPPAAMPPLPLSHSQNGLADASHASASAVSSRRHTPTMTAMAKPTAQGDVPLAPRTLAPLSDPTAGAGAAPPLDKDAKPLKKHHSKKKKKRNSVSELTPLILKGQQGKGSSEEEVHPLPWFRSPEWPRKSPLLTNDKRRKPSANRFRRGRTSREQTSLCNSILSTVCCGLGASHESDVDLELGTRRSDSEQLESEGFKQCVQFLVGLIVVVAAGLIVMIIFQPFQQDSSLW